MATNFGARSVTSQDYAAEVTYNSKSYLFLAEECLLTLPRLRHFGYIFNRPEVERENYNHSFDK